MKLPRPTLPEAYLALAVVGALLHPSWPILCALGLSVVLYLGVRLITYRQAEDVAALAARLAKVEDEAKRALNLASASAQRKAAGF